jgi:endonuclease III
VSHKLLYELFIRPLALAWGLLNWYNIDMATQAELKKRAGHARKYLNKLYPDAFTELNFKTPFQLLIATILSAQCTDVLVNKVTKELFKKYKKPEDLAKAKLTTLQKDVYPVTFYKNKAKMIKATAEKIAKEHKGNVPKDLNELIKLPGVARKTANVVLGHAYTIPSGFVVDTHVLRVSKRLGLSKNTDPKKLEEDLMKLIPQKHWIKFADQLIFHGRRSCTARNDKCDMAKLTHYSK